MIKYSGQLQWSDYFPVKLPSASRDNRIWYLQLSACVRRGPPLSQHPPSPPPVCAVVSFFFFFERCSGEKRAREQHSGETIAPQGMSGPGSCEEDVNMNPLVLLFLTLLNENTSPPHGRCWPPVYPDPVGWLWLVDVISPVWAAETWSFGGLFLCMCVWNLV